MTADVEGTEDIFEIVMVVEASVVDPKESAMMTLSCRGAPDGS